jgi:uncharacterized membrane protein YfcA
MKFKEALLLCFIWACSGMLGAAISGASGDRIFHTGWCIFFAALLMWHVCCNTTKKENEND